MKSRSDLWQQPGLRWGTRVHAKPSTGRQRALRRLQRDGWIVIDEDGDSWLLLNHDRTALPPVLTPRKTILSLNLHDLSGSISSDSGPEDLRDPLSARGYGEAKEGTRTLRGHLEDYINAMRDDYCEGPSDGDSLGAQLKPDLESLTDEWRTPDDRTLTIRLQEVPRDRLVEVRVDGRFETVPFHLAGLGSSSRGADPRRNLLPLTVWPASIESGSRAVSRAAGIDGASRHVLVLLGWLNAEESEHKNTEAKDTLETTGDVLCQVLRAEGITPHIARFATEDQMIQWWEDEGCPPIRGLYYFGHGGPCTVSLSDGEGKPRDHDMEKVMKWVTNRTGRLLDTAVFESCKGVGSGSVAPLMGYTKTLLLINGDAKQYGDDQLDQVGRFVASFMRKYARDEESFAAAVRHARRQGSVDDDRWARFFAFGRADQYWNEQ